MLPEPKDVACVLGDAVAQLLLCGKVEALREAKELYLDSLPEVVRLFQSGLWDEDPLVQMLRSHGSRGCDEGLD